MLRRLILRNASDTGRMVRRLPSLFEICAST